MFLVYINIGTCGMGNHTVELLVFESEQEALAKAEAARGRSEEGFVAVIYGEVVVKYSWPP